MFAQEGAVVNKWPLPSFLSLHFLFFARNGQKRKNLFSFFSSSLEKVLFFFFPVKYVFLHTPLHQKKKTAQKKENILSTYFWAKKDDTYHANFHISTFLLIARLNKLSVWPIPSWCFFGFGMEVSPEAPSSYPPPPCRNCGLCTHTSKPHKKKGKRPRRSYAKKFPFFVLFPDTPQKKYRAPSLEQFRFFFQERGKRSCSTKGAAAFKAQHFHRLNAKEVSVSHFWSVFFFLGFVTAREKKDPPTHGASFFPPPLKRERGILVVAPAPGFGFLVAVPITKALGDEF